MIGGGGHGVEVVSAGLVGEFVYTAPIYFFE